MQPPDSSLFTPTEAAVLTRLTLKAVNNAIDKKTVSAVTGERAGRPIRLLDARALVSLTLERRLADRVAPELRRQVFDALAEAPRNVVSLEGGLLKIDLREPRRELATSLRELRRARRLVVSDPDIMGGDPVFRGTRVPVHMIANLVAQGSTPAEMLESYPRLTPEMIRLAPLYAAAYPPRGRPRTQPWRDQKPVHRTRRRLDTIACREVSDRRMSHRRPGFPSPGSRAMTPSTSHMSARPAGKTGTSRATPATAILSSSPTTRATSGVFMRCSHCMPALSFSFRQPAACCSGNCSGRHLTSSRSSASPSTGCSRWTATATM